MVNLNSVPERTWMRVIQACDEQWVHRSACGRYLLTRQRVYTPGHDYQIHIRPLLGRWQHGNEKLLSTCERGQLLGDNRLRRFAARTPRGSALLSP